MSPTQSVLPLEEPAIVKERQKQLHDADECCYWLCVSLNELRWLDSLLSISDELRDEVRAYLAQQFGESNDMFECRMGEA